MKLNAALLQDISDDIDFYFKLAKEEAVILLPGSTPIQNIKLFYFCRPKWKNWEY